VRSIVRHERRVVLIALGAAALPFIVAIVRVLIRHDFALNGDDALIELRVRDVGEHTPLLGSYQRFGWNQPGPLLFYLLAVPYRLTGSDFAGLQVGALLLNAAAVMAIGVLACRRGRLTLFRWTMVLTGVLTRALGGFRVADPWEPNVTVLVGALLLVLAADAATGRVWTLPLVAGVASLVAQAYAVVAPVAATLFAWAVVAGFVRGREQPRRTRVRAAAVSAAVLVVLWLPPLIEELGAGTGNVEAMVDFARTERATIGLADGYRAVALQFDHRASWLGADPPIEAFAPTVDLTVAPALPAALLVLVAAAGLAVARRSPAVVLAVTVLIAAGAGVLAMAQLIDGVFSWNVEWARGLGMACWLASGWCVYCSLQATTRRVVDRVVAPVLLIAVLALAGLNVARFSSTAKTSRLQEALLALAGRAVAESRGVDGSVLVRSEATSRQVAIGGAVGAEVVALALERAGVDVVVDRDLGNRFGDHRAHPERAAAEFRLVFGDDRPQGFRVAATVDPLTPAERRTRQRLERALASLTAGVAPRPGDTLATLGDELERNPKLRAVVEQLAAIDDLDPLTLLVRDL
jgi:hypothetical protein